MCMAHFRIHKTTRETGSNEKQKLESGGEDGRSNCFNERHRQDIPGRQSPGSCKFRTPVAKEDAIAAGKAAVEGKITGNIVKEIYVPKKIVNLVVK